MNIQHKFEAVIFLTLFSLDELGLKTRAI